jgi:haloalkane dehalogenase
VKWPELIELFATRNLSALSSAIAQNPEQFGWVVNFQRENFKRHLNEKHKARYDQFLGAVIDANLKNVPGAGPAFMQMTGQFFSELDRNTQRLQLVDSLQVPSKIIWGANDPYINLGVAKDFQSHLKSSSLQVIEAGHWLQIDEPELVADAMLS